MCFKLFSVVFVIAAIECTPINHHHHPHVNEDEIDENLLKFDNEYRNKLENYLYELIEKYIDKYVEDKPETDASFDRDEDMQGDMPVVDGHKINNITSLIVNKTNDFSATFLPNFGSFNFTRPNNFTTLNAQQRHEINSKEAKRIKQRRMENIKKTILYETGRKNDSMTNIFNNIGMFEFKKNLNETGLDDLNISINPKIPDVQNEKDDVEYVEKIRSFYPKCEMPRNQDQEMWNDEKTMNLYFNVDYKSQSSKDDTVNIASATLRLYKLPQDGNATGSVENCKDAQFLSDDDKQIRVSVYWYSKLKKHKVVKKRLADSKMVPLVDKFSSNYVEFNIRPATKAWVRGKNLGLGVVVEDMDGQVLPSDRYFRDVGCHMVGNVSTPKPIPTLVIDAFRNGFGTIINGTNGIASANYTDVPKIDICTIELPYNQTKNDPQTDKIACRNFQKNNKSNKKILNNFNLGDNLEALTDFLGIKLRHHDKRQQKSESALTDLQHSILDKKIIISKEQLGQIHQLTQHAAKNQNKNNR